MMSADPTPFKKYFVPAALIVLFGISLGTRYYGFNQPHGLTFDEGLYAELLAEQLKTDPINYSTQEAYRYQTSIGQRVPAYLDRPLFKHPPLYLYCIALFYKVFGSGHLAAVSVSIIFGSLMIPVIFLLGAKLYDDRVGLLAAFLLCIDPVHWACSEKIWMETAMSFFILSAVYLFAVGQERKRFLPLAGLSAGLAILVKYPGVLALGVIVVYTILMNRSLLKEKLFWSLIGAAFVVILPWIIWNVRVYGDLDAMLISAHKLSYHWESAAGILSEHGGALVLILVAAGVLFAFRHKLAFSNKKLTTAIFILSCCAVLFVPLLRDMFKEAFLLRGAVETGWSNPFAKGPWPFYITRLIELSPFYLFSFIAFLFMFGRNKGDVLIVWASLIILGAFILLGNYQSRYILPAVPFLLLLSARFQVAAYDKLSPHSGPDAPASDAQAYLALLKIALVGLGIYFVFKTFRTDALLALKPDFGYF